MKTSRPSFPHSHHCVSLQELQAQIRAGIALQGFALRHVLASEHEPAFSYTVGLSAPGSSRPEILISGLSVEARATWLLEIGFQIQGPPPLATRRQMARVQGVALDALTFPPGGAAFHPGKRYGDLAESGLPLCFGEITPEYYETHLGQAIAFHRTTAFPVLQLIWSDPRGAFPWEKAYEARMRKAQRLLCDPQRFLPLRDAEA